ncbi:hypothetical protein [Stenotrophomonas sp. S39]|uniref:ankyrin repeat domain-containing protein n=1 Tax=Stenotrophomonas sp. S39 TaxID=2767451 RepID=UPI00190ADA0A|nr:hypothetical protein [Stenotrophomonas sp. S39]MBK0052972.1 hypothetical protein [Stenotrophomonas sp. S39]
MNQVSWQSSGGSLVVKVPYGIKDDFRSEFKTAKWSSREKGWLVGDNKRNLNKLEEWASGQVAEKMNLIDAGSEPALEGPELERAKARIAEVAKYQLPYEAAQQFYDEARAQVEAFNQMGGTLSLETIQPPNTMEVGIVQRNGKVAIAAPFDLKDALKGTFPTAKWDSANKSWTIDDVPGHISKAEAWKSLVDQLQMGLAASLTTQAQELRERLMEATPKIQNIQEPDVHTVLKTSNTSAVLDRDAVKKFFEMHDINAPIKVLSLTDNKELTPLAFVAAKIMGEESNRHVLDVMNDMIEMGANVNSKVKVHSYSDGDGDLDSRSLVDLVDLANSLERVALLVKNGAPAKEDHIEWLMKSSADIHLLVEKYAEMIQPHHFASIHAHREGSQLMEQLVLSGLDVNAQGERGDTALHHIQNIEDAKFLVDAGASTDIVNKKGERFADRCNAAFVERNASQAGVQLMKELGVDLNAADQYSGNTALHRLMQKGSNPELIHNLLEAGADPLVRNSKGQTPANMEVPFGINREDHIESKSLLENYTLKRAILSEDGDALNVRRSQVRRM